ncbi:unnamed protein product, partial [Vitis vinifera]|uniref:Uncharacterized protein n=1 Tax=Vitis vinifera TaxID=29760 RepID=D7SWX6_VITVI
MNGTSIHFPYLYLTVCTISPLLFLSFLSPKLKDESQDFIKRQQCENGLPKRKWQPILLKEMGFLVPKNSRIEKKCEVGII